MIQQLIYFVLFFNVQSQTNIPIGWFVDEKSSNNVAANTFIQALTAATNLTGTLAWPKSQYTFQSLHENVHTDNIYASVHQICNRLESGAIGTISSINNPKTRLLEIFMRRLHISMVSLNYFNYNKQEFPPSNKFYHLTMKIDLLPALAACIRRYKVTRLFYIFEGDEAFERYQAMMVAQAREKSYDILDIQGRHLIDSTNSNHTRNLLQSVEINDRGSKEERYIVLDLYDINSYVKLLMQIRHHGMTTPHYHYIIMSLEADRIDMRTFRYGGVNVTYFLPKSVYKMNSSSDPLVYDRLALPSFEKKALADTLYLYMQAIMSLDERTRAKIIDSDSTDDNFDHLKIDCRSKGRQQSHEPFGDKLFQMMKSITFEGYSGNVAFNEYGERLNYTLNVYQVTMNRLPRHIGNFTHDEFAFDDLRVFEGRQAHDFDKGKERIISTIIDEPFAMLNTSALGNMTASQAAGQYFTFDQLHGYCIDLARLICEQKLEIPCKFRIVKDNSFGNKPTNDQPWTGMIGELVRHEVDLAIGPLTITSQRESVVDFSKPWMNLGISILISKPEKIAPGIFSFMAPLSKEIWICVIISYLLVSAILFFVSRTSSYEWYFENETDVVPRNKFSMQNALFFSFAAFMHQGVDLLPRSFSGRVVTSAWWFFSLILVSSYTANLAAFLTVEKLVTPIESVEDLAKQTEIRYGTVKGGSTMAFFNKSTLITFKRMWDFMQQHKDDVFVTSNHEGIEKVRRSKGKFAFLLESTLNEYVNERYPCDTMRVGENIDAKGYGIATPLGSDLREAINIAVLELTESGFLERLKQKWYYERSECTNVGTKDSKQSTELNLANVAGMFYVLIVGLGAAMVIAFLEFLLKAKIDSTRLNQNIREVMRRNLRISITGIDFDEKQQHTDYWPLQAPPHTSPVHPENERTATVSSTYDSLKHGEFLGFNEQKDLTFRGSKRDNISHL